MELPETEYPTEREARIAKRHNEMVNEMKFTPYWIDPPMRATTGVQQLPFCDLHMRKRGGNAGDLTGYSSRRAEIERWSDQFKPKTASAATAVAALRTVHAARQYDKELLPPSAFEAIFEKKPRGKSTVKGQSSASLSCPLCAARRALAPSGLRRAEATLRCADPMHWPFFCDRPEHAQRRRPSRRRRCKSAFLALGRRSRATYH